MCTTNFAYLFRVLGLLTCFGTAVGQHMNANNAPCQGTGPAAAATQCFVSESQSADKELSSVLVELRKVLTIADRRSLQVAQSLWLQFRDANCAAERGLYRGGSAAPAVYYACIAADTRHRTAELNTMYGWRLRK